MLDLKFAQGLFKISSAGIVSNPNFTVLFSDSNGPLGLQQDGQAEWNAKLAERSKLIHEELNKLLGKRRESLLTITDNRVFNRIRATAPDLQAIIKAATPVVQKFWTEHIAPTAANENELWNTFGLANGNFEELSRVLLAKTLGEEFLRPLDANDKFVIKIQDPGYGGLLDSVIDGTNVDPALISEGGAVLPASRLAPDRAVRFPQVGFSPEKGACSIYLRK